MVVVVVRGSVRVLQRRRLRVVRWAWIRVAHKLRRRWRQLLVEHRHNARWRRRAHHDDDGLPGWRARQQVLLLLLLLLLLGRLHEQRH
jgi:hypothetical protein